jgi:hypothetical protein
MRENARFGITLHFAWTGAPWSSSEAPAAARAGNGSNVTAGA